MAIHTELCMSGIDAVSASHFQTYYIEHSDFLTAVAVSAQLQLRLMGRAIGPRTLNGT